MLLGLMLPRRTRVLHPMTGLKRANQRVAQVRENSTGSHRASRFLGIAPKKHRPIRAFLRRQDRPSRVVLSLGATRYVLKARHERSL